jgi:hypothetical protein
VTEFDDPMKIMQEMEGSDEPSSQTPRKKRRRPRFASGLDSVGAMESARATYPKSQIAGQYIRRTFTWTPGQLEMITRIQQEMGLEHETEAARVLMDLNICAFLDGERPEVEEETVKIRPKLEEW